MDGCCGYRKALVGIAIEACPQVGVVRATKKVLLTQFEAPGLSRSLNMVH